MGLLILMSLLAHASPDERWRTIKESCDSSAITKSRLLFDSVDVIKLYEQRKSNIEAKIKAIKRYITDHDCSPEVYEDSDLED